VVPGDLGKVMVCLGGRMWPQGVEGDLRGSGVAWGLRMALWVRRWSLGIVGSWVAMGGRRWPQGVTVDLGGLRVTLIT
jgi:hypothetical protein